MPEKITYGEYDEAARHRALERARLAIAAASGEGDSDAWGDETAITDLMADLLHEGISRGLDPEALIGTARMHATAEAGDAYDDAGEWADQNPGERD